MVSSLINKTEVRQKRRPFSDPNDQYICFKRNCCAILYSQEKLEIHERFYHYLHPLSGGSVDTQEKQKPLGLRTESSEEENEEEKIQKMMFKMSTLFFNECGVGGISFGGKGRDVAAVEEGARE